MLSIIDARYIHCIMQMSHGSKLRSFHDSGLGLYNRKAVAFTQQPGVFQTSGVFIGLSARDRTSTIVA
jgi:hypothetical protein